MSKDEWTEVAHERFTEESPQVDEWRTTDFTLFKRGGRWKVEVIMQLDAGSRREDKDIAGRGDSPQEACDVIRPTVFGWTNRYSYHDGCGAALRQLCYTVEDNEYEETKR